MLPQSHLAVGPHTAELHPSLRLQSGQLLVLHHEHSLLLDHTGKMEAQVPPHITPPQPHLAVGPFTAEPLPPTPPLDLDTPLGPPHGQGPLPEGTGTMGVTIETTTTTTTATAWHPRVMQTRISHPQSPHLRQLMTLL